MLLLVVIRTRRPRAIDRDNIVHMSPSNCLQECRKQTLLSEVQGYETMCITKPEPHEAIEFHHKLQSKLSFNSYTQPRSTTSDKRSMPSRPLPLLNYALRQAIKEASKAKVAKKIFFRSGCSHCRPCSSEIASNVKRYAEMCIQAKDNRDELRTMRQC